MGVDALMILAVILQAASLNLCVLYLTRFIFGLFTGISTAIIPPYLNSISPMNMIGIVGSYNQLLITVGT
jgi:SP family sugar:H+ symporter-like MFS transporter